MLFCFFLLSSQGVVRKDSGVRQLLQNNLYTLVISTPIKGSSNVDFIESIDNLTTIYGDNISFIHTSSDISKEFSLNHLKITKFPIIYIFYEDIFIKVYDDEYNYKAINKICKKLNSENYVHINNVYDLYDFRNKGPVNVMVYNSEFFEKAKILSKRYNTLIPFALVECDIPCNYGQNIVITNVYEDTNISVEDFNSIEKYLDIRIMNAYSRRSFYISRSDHTLIFLHNNKYPLQLYRIKSLIKELSVDYNSTISYQICKYKHCEDYINGFDLYNYNSFMVLLHSKKDDTVKTLKVLDPEYPNVKMFLYNIFNNQNLECPLLNNHTFYNNIVNGRKDSVIFIYNKDDTIYKETKRNYIRMINLLSDLSTLSFYEYNPDLHPVDNFRVPHLEQPIISIFPRSNIQKQGYTIKADVPFALILDEIIKNIRFKPSFGIFQRLQKAVGSK